MFFNSSVRQDGLSYWCKECSKKKKENCSVCGRFRVVNVRVDEQPYCIKCYRGKYKSKIKCVECNKFCFPVLKEGVCQHCYDLRPRIGLCSVCDKMKSIKLNNENEIVCTQCYESDRRPLKQCILCGKTKRVGKMLEDGPMCISCYDGQLERVAARFKAQCKRRNNDPFELLAQEWHKLMCEFDWECFYCNCHLSNENRTIDHIIPLSKGGNSKYENLVPSCGRCNRQKGTKDFIKWAEEICLPLKKIQHIKERLQEK